MYFELEMIIKYSCHDVSCTFKEVENLKSVLKKFNESLMRQINEEKESYEIVHKS